MHAGAVSRSSPRDFPNLGEGSLQAAPTTQYPRKDYDAVSLRNAMNFSGVLKMVYDPRESNRTEADRPDQASTQCVAL